MVTQNAEVKESKLLDLNHMTPEQVTDAEEKGDITPFTEEDGTEGYVLTEQGKLRVLVGSLSGIIDDVIEGYHHGRSYGKTVEYLKSIRSYYTKGDVDAT